MAQINDRIENILADYGMGFIGGFHMEHAIYSALCEARTEHLSELFAKACDMDREMESNDGIYKLPEGMTYSFALIQILQQMNLMEKRK